MRRLNGIAAAPGIAIGPIAHFNHKDLVVELRSVKEADLELHRFEQAAATAIEQVDSVYQKAKTELGEEKAAIFDAQRMMLQDPELIEMIRRSIVENRINAEYAVNEATEHYAKILESAGNEYFRERASDVRDIAARLMKILLGLDGDEAGGLNEASIIIASDLAPSDTVLLDKDKLLGFCIVEGGITSHTAILARGLGIPAIVGGDVEVLTIPEGTRVILDGFSGELIIDPTIEIVEVYKCTQKKNSAAVEAARAHCHEPAVTRDSVKVEVVANIGSIEGAKTAIEYGAEGVGLLRTEFLYMERDSLPGEEEQFNAYSAIFEIFGEHPIILRTSDIGGDKELPYLDLPKELNPFLGVRGLRLGLLNPEEILKPQLRAAIRAGNEHDLRIMFPMVTEINEVRQARHIFEECKAELIGENYAVPEKIQIGIMIEVPAAALMADVFAKEVDFFSIGTNDLTQYTLAADRINPQLSHLSNAFSPSVLRLIKNVIAHAHSYGKWVGLCGELAGDPLAIPILLGLGLDEFSMNPMAIPTAKQIIRKLDTLKCRDISEAVLHLESAEAVIDYTAKNVPEVAGIYK